MMKKMIIFIFVFVLLVTPTVESFATNMGNSSEVNDFTVDLITTEAFQVVFENTSGVRSVLAIDNIAYNYSLIPQENDPDTAIVNLHFVMVVGHNNYPASLTGTVDAYVLNSGDVLWEGPLFGTITINNDVYSVIAGFSKLNSLTDVEVNVTIQSSNSENAIDPIVFSFGEKVITSEIYNEIIQSVDVAANHVDETADAEIASTMTSIYSFNYLGDDYEYFNSSAYDVSGHSQRTRGYFQPSTNRFAVTMKSYCSNIENYFSLLGTATVSICECTYNLRFNDDGDVSKYARIDGIQYFGFEPTDLGVAGTALKPLFQDIMTLLEIPTSIISAIFDGLTGKVTHSDYTDNNSVTVEFGLAKIANFDDSDVGVPIVFALDNVPATYEGNSSFTFSTSISYRVVFTTDDPSAIPVIFYIDGYDTSKTVTIDLM